MSCSPVSPVEVDCVTDIEMTHEFSKVSQRCLYKKMKMDTHQNIAVKLDGICLYGLKQGLQEGRSICIISVYIPSFISPAGYMIHCSGILYPYWPCHGKLS